MVQGAAVAARPKPFSLHFVSDDLLTRKSFIQPARHQHAANHVLSSMAEMHPGFSRWLPDCAVIEDSLHQLQQTCAAQAIAGVCLPDTVCWHVQA